MDEVEFVLPAFVFVEENKVISLLFFGTTKRRCELLYKRGINGRRDSFPGEVSFMCSYRTTDEKIVWWSKSLVWFVACRFCEENLREMNEKMKSRQEKMLCWRRDWRFKRVIRRGNFGCSVSTKWSEAKSGANWISQRPPVIGWSNLPDL